MKSASAIPYSVGDIGSVLAEVFEGKEGHRETVVIYAPALGYDGVSVSSLSVVRSTVIRFTAQDKEHWVPVTAVLAVVRSERDNRVAVYLVGSRTRP